MRSKKGQEALVELVGGTDVDWPKNDYFAAEDLIEGKIDAYVLTFGDKGQQMTRYDWENLRLGLISEINVAYADNEAIRKRLTDYVGSEEHGRIAHLQFRYLSNLRSSWTEDY